MWLSQAKLGSNFVTQRCWIKLIIPCHNKSNFLREQFITIYNLIVQIRLKPLSNTTSESSSYRKLHDWREAEAGPAHNPESVSNASSSHSSQLDPITGPHYCTRHDLRL